MSWGSAVRRARSIGKSSLTFLWRECVRCWRWMAWHWRDMWNSPEWWLAWLWIRTKQMLRLLLSDLGALGVCATVFIGMFGVILAMSPALKSASLSAVEDREGVIRLLLAALLMSILGMVATAYLALRALGPSAYAQLAIQGRDLVETLTVLSIEVRYACRQFLEDTKQLHSDLFEELTVIGPGNRLIPVSLNVAQQKTHGNANRLEARLADVHVALIRGRQNALRLLGLKKTAADQLSIPQRRLCDYLLEYSPYMHLELSQQYFEHCRRLIPHSDSNATEIPAVQYPLTEKELEDAINSLNGIRTRFALCLEHHNAFLRHRDLFSFVHRIASQHSTSACVSAYASALSYVAASAQRRIARVDRDQSTPCDVHVEEALRILYRKQRAYPGADLHAACVRMIGRAEKGCGPTGNAFEPLSKTGRTVARMNGVLGVVQRAGLGPPRPQDTTCPIEWQNIGDLAYLSSWVTGGINACQEKIAERLPGHIAEQLNADSKDIKQEDVAIITSGYSTTVKKCIMEMAKNNIGRHRLKYVLVVAVNPDEDLDGFRMRDELRHSEAIKGTDVRIIHGDADILFKSLRNTILRIVLLGAEIVTESPDGKHRVIHPRNSMEWLSKYPIPRRVIVAECYKELKDDLLAPEGIGRRQIGRLTVVENVDVVSCCERT